MTETRGERRAETAKQNDDSAIIEAAEEEALGGQVFEGSKGGDLKRDVATQAELKRVRDPEAHESVTKGDHIAHGEESIPPHPPERVLEDRD